jgi:hypothetical protein
LVSLSSSALTFAAQKVGTGSSQMLTLTHAGKASLAISSITTSGDLAQTDTCRGSAAAGGSCTIMVTFKPTTTGRQSGTLTLKGNNTPIADAKMQRNEITFTAGSTVYTGRLKGNVIEGTAKANGSSVPWRATRTE